MLSTSMAQGSPALLCHLDGRKSGSFHHYRRLQRILQGLCEIYNKFAQKDTGEEAEAGKESGGLKNNVLNHIFELTLSEKGAILEIESAAWRQ